MRVEPALRAAVRAGVACGLAVGLAVGASACGSEEEIPKTVLSQDSPGFAADADLSPDLEDGTDMSLLAFDRFDGGTGTVADYRGKPLVVNFFASWCPPCVREMPEFQAVFERLGGRVAFLGLSQDQAQEDALALVESTGVRYDVGWDPDLEVYAETGSIAMPTTAFVSASGKLVDVFAGVLDEESLAELIEDALGVADRP